MRPEDHIGQVYSGWTVASHVSGYAYVVSCNLCGRRKISSPSVFENLRECRCRGFLSGISPRLRPIRFDHRTGHGSTVTVLCECGIEACLPLNKTLAKRKYCSQRCKLFIRDMRKSDEVEQMLLSGRNSSQIMEATGLSRQRIHQIKQRLEKEHDIRLPRMSPGGCCARGRRVGGRQEARPVV